MLTIAISSRSLFHMEEGNAIFESEGQKAFDDYMARTENEPLPPGTAFSLVRKLMLLNSSRALEKPDRVEVVLLSRNSANAGARVMNSVMHYNLGIEQAVFTHGGDRFAYADAMGADLFLCSHAADARKALAHGMAAAHIAPSASSPDLTDETLRIAFDGDAVLFSGEADQVYRTHGLERFVAEEVRNAGTPLGDGPFRRFFTKLCEIQAEVPEGRLLTGLFTARGGSVHGRALNTLRSWGLTVNVASFRDGRPKGPLLRAFGADMFFDDGDRNIESAAAHQVPAGTVLSGDGGLMAKAA